MHVSVKTRWVYIDIRGIIPGALLDALRLEYGYRLRVRAEGFEEMVDVHCAELYEKQSMEMNPGAYLRIYRQNRDITQGELGRMLGGISRQNISNIENGRRPISKNLAIELSRLFGVSVDKFIGLT